jgi:hypothetical protein
MKKLVLLITLIILFSFLGGCNRQKKEKIATPSDIEVRISTQPAGFHFGALGVLLFTAIEYEGTVTNIGEGKAPLVKIKITWEAAFKQYTSSESLTSGVPEECKYLAFREETFKNLRPGETRQFKGIMNISWLDEKSKMAWNFYGSLDGGGGLFKEAFNLGKSYYTVDVLPEENKN